MNKQEIIKIIGKKRWTEFLKWMTGQTVGINKDGSENYYAWDVQRFIDGKEVID